MDNKNRNDRHSLGVTVSDIIGLHFYNKGCSFLAKPRVKVAQLMNCVAYLTKGWYKYFFSGDCLVDGSDQWFQTKK